MASHEIGNKTPIPYDIKVGIVMTQILLEGLFRATKEPTKIQLSRINHSIRRRKYGG